MLYCFYGFLCVSIRQGLALSMSVYYHGFVIIYFMIPHNTNRHSKRMRIKVSGPWPWVWRTSCSRTASVIVVASWVTSAYRREIDGSHLGFLQFIRLSFLPIIRGLKIDAVVTQKMRMDVTLRIYQNNGVHAFSYKVLTLCIWRRLDAHSFLFMIQHLNAVIVEYCSAKIYNKQRVC